MHQPCLNTQVSERCQIRLHQDLDDLSLLRAFEQPVGEPSIIVDIVATKDVLGLHWSRRNRKIALAAKS